MEKKRSSKTTRKQYELYLGELEENVDFRENKFIADRPDTLKISWENLVRKLNSTGGPKKDVTSWKKTFSDWKCQIRKRARLIQQSLNATGNKGDVEKPLSDLEKRLLHLTGEIVIKGIPDVEEIGIETKQASIETGSGCQSKVVHSVPTDSGTEEKVIIHAPTTIEKENLPPRSLKRKRTLHTTIENLQDYKMSEKTELENINKSLQIIIAQNYKKIWLEEKKIQLKYNIKIMDSESDESD